jgi:hypothetical protein
VPEKANVPPVAKPRRPKPPLAASAFEFGRKAKAAVSTPENLPALKLPMDCPEAERAAVTQAPPAPFGQHEARPRARSADIGPVNGQRIAARPALPSEKASEY